MRSRDPNEPIGDDTQHLRDIVAAVQIVVLQKERDRLEKSPPGDVKKRLNQITKLIEEYLKELLK